MPSDLQFPEHVCNPTLSYYGTFIAPLIARITLGRDLAYIIF